MAAEEYWLQRNIDNEEAMHRSLDAKEKVILDAYNQAQIYLEKQVSKIYKRYLNKSELDEGEVKKILNTKAGPADLMELQRLAKRTTNKDVQKELNNYLTGLAVKHRITLLEDLKAKSFLVAKDILDVQLDVQTDFYIDVIHEAYDEAAHEAIIGQAEQKIELTEREYPKYKATRSDEILEIRNVQTDEVIRSVKLRPDDKIPEFKELSTKYVKNILESDWKGSNYSKRIWKDTDTLAKRLEKLFTVQNLTGMSEHEMSKALAKEFETSMYVARRLIRTEANYFAGQAKLKSWIEHGVEEYVIIAVLDFRTSEICKEQDGKIYKVKDAVVGETYVPFHVWCRSVAAAYFGKRTLDGNRTAIDRVTGETMQIAQRSNYKDWEQKLIAKHGKPRVERAKKMIKNHKADLNQFRRYKNVLKEDAPKTLDEFQEIKYSNKSEYEKLKKLYRELRK